MAAHRPGGPVTSRNAARDNSCKLTAVSLRRQVSPVKPDARVFAWLCAFAFALACASFSRAQETKPTPVKQETQAVESPKQPGRTLRSQSDGVRGVVVDENGSPVEGSSVFMLAPSVDVTLVKTDAEGYFDFGIAQAHWFSLTVQAEGFGRFVRHWEAGEWKGEALRVVLAPPALA